MSGEQIEVDMATMTMGELAEAMEAANISDADSATGADRIRLLAGFAYVVKRQTDPTFTFEDALRLPMGAVKVTGVEEDPEADRGVSSGAPRLASLVPGS